LDAKLELRKAHFSFGSPSVDNNETFKTMNQEKSIGKDSSSKYSKVTVERGTNIYYGRDNPVYQSMMNDQMV
jgi:hypothetical protein